MTDRDALNEIGGNTMAHYADQQREREENEPEPPEVHCSECGVLITDEDPFDAGCGDFLCQKCVEPK